MKRGSAPAAASLESVDAGRTLVKGPLNFATVGPLLAAGSAAIAADKAREIDLAGVPAGDSAGLALMVEWLSVARAADRPLHFLNIPAQFLQLARLTGLEPLLTAA